MIESDSDCAAFGGIRVSNCRNYGASASWNDDCPEVRCDPSTRWQERKRIGEIICRFLITEVREKPDSEHWKW